MAYSSGARSVVFEAVSWAVAASVVAVAFVHFDSLKTVTATVLGMPHVAEPAMPGVKPARVEPAPAPDGASVVLQAEANGHFHASAEINGRPVNVMVDTGATMVALTYKDARAAGLYLASSDFTHGVSTANGVARVAPVMLDKVSIGDITVRDVQAVVSEDGKLETSLLGMTFLNRLDRVDMRSGRLMLQD